MARALVGILVMAMVVGGALAAVGSEQAEREGTRLAGPTRIETAIAVAQHRFPDGAPVAYLAAQDLNPDALVAGGLADGPLLLVPRCGPLPQAVADELDRLEPSRVTVVGGPGAVAAQVLRQAVNGQREPSLACPGAYPSEGHGVRMTVAEDHQDPDVAARLVLANHADARRYTGADYQLERFADGGFEPVEGEWVWPAVLYYIEPGGSHEITVSAWVPQEGGETEPLAPGRYRVVKRVLLDQAGEQSFLLAGEFVHR